LSTSDAVWSEQGTTPDAIEAALRALLAKRHAESASFIPARVLNMIVFVDDEWSGEIANRLRGVGRYAPSRLLVLSYEPGRTRLDARATIASDAEPADDELALLRETVIVKLGERHLDDLLTIADPLVVTDLPTLLWSPHGHADAVDELLSLAQATLVDSIEEPDRSQAGHRTAVDRACELSKQVYVVDLAWLRSTPWRERVATVFDPQPMRGELHNLSSVKVRHHPDSRVAALLLVGWLASRLGWSLKRSEVTAEGTAGKLCGSAQSQRGEVKLTLTPAPDQQVPGLAGVELTSSSGLRIRLDREPGGLRAHRRDAGSERERTWTLLGASRGEGGILGEGIRQALLRDPTYGAALTAVQEMLPEAVQA
jgi:glucose-6-phosphate dehydrogenase assembly protein OpcA